MTLFRFPCYRELKQELGELDALCECIELATRDLIWRTLATPDQQAFIGELAERHGIRVNRLDVPALRPHVARLYILSVYQCLEDFLVGLHDEHPEGRTWEMEDKAGRPKEDRATKIARSIAFQPTLAFDLCQHYRVIRNATMHPGARDDLREDDPAAHAAQPCGSRWSPEVA
ncbi:MAG: hypothetical protein H6721_32800 [Sandaracinus sp.]|nr:hypothetical protein [Sandaracinus sp.]